MPFAGTVPNERLDEKYKQADIFVLSSLAEGMPLVVLEAMASGLPVAGANYRAIPELVKNGKNGSLFDPFDSQDCAKAIIKTLDKDSRIQKQAYKTVEVHSIERVVDRLIELYEEMVELRRKWLKSK